MQIRNIMNSPIDYKKFELFPTPVYKSKIEVQDRWLKLCKSTEYDRMKTGNGDISKNRNILDNLDLKNDIEDHINVYVRDWLKVHWKTEFYLTSSWLVQHKKGDWAQLHHHANSLISGVYYLKTPENSGDLFFHRNVNHLLSANLAFETLEDTNINNDLIKFNVKEGMIIIFPSNVFHSIGKTNSIDSRYCIAFNSYIVGDISKYNEGSLHIKDVE